MNNTTRRVRRLAASVTFAAVAGGLALPLLASSPAQAIQETTTSRIEGQDRYGTAAAVALDTFPDGTDSVVLATGQKFADALAANGLAGALGAPILLTTTASLPEATQDAITTLNPSTIYVMGGTAAVSQDVEDQLAADHTIVRVEGQDRWETAAEAGRAIAATDDNVPATTGDGLGSTSDGLTAVLANGFKFPDAVSSGPVAFAGRLPILLTEAGTLPAATSTALEELEIEHVLLIGGTTAINDSIKAALESDGYTTERLAGNDRFATNVEVNEYATAELGFGGPTAYLSNGSKFPDALSGGPVAGTNAAPLVLTSPTALPTPARNYLAANGNGIDEVIAIGGTAAVDDATLAAAADAAQLATNNAFEVTPTESATQPLSSSPFTSEGARAFDVTGLEAGGTYVIALLDSETVDPSGGVTFESYSLSDEASTSIESINGSPVGAAGGIETVQEEATATDEGTLRFVVDATAADSIFPVVFEDLDEDGTLTLAGQVADEPFGIGGKTTWLPGEAADTSSSNTYNDVTVTALSTEDNYFVADGDTFLYDTTDRFRSDTPTAESATITPGQFEGMLTVGDVLDITYFRSSQSMFDVVTDTIPDIADVSASTPSTTRPNLVQISWEPSEQPDAVYTVFRDDGDGTLDDGDVEVSAKDDSTSRSFLEPTATTGVRYIVLTEGGTSGTDDTTDDDGDPVTFISNEITPGQALFGLTEGTTVSKNAGLALLNAGDELMLHFSRDVKVASNASITIKEGTGNEITLTNGTATSTWTVAGRSITITLGSGADAAPDVSYGEETLVTGLSGVSDVGGTSIPVTALRDKVVENDGPELMVESTTCDVGDTVCTITFNEPVSEGSAENRANYTYVPEGGGRFLNSIVLAEDLRTITLTFSAGVGDGDQIRPVGPISAVNDDDSQASNQALFDFVR